MIKIKTPILILTLVGSVMSAQSAEKSVFGTPLSVQANVSTPSLAPAREISTITALPAPGLVNSISEVKITFVGASKLDVTASEDDRTPKLVMTDGDVILCSEATASGNTLTIKFNPEITQEGTYTLNVPRWSVKVDYAALHSDLNFTYTVGVTGDNGIIYEAPDGETIRCQSDFLSYFVVDGGLSGMPVAGKPLHYVLGKDGNLYLYNIMTLQPYGSQQTSSYIVGTPSGEKKWKFAFPQPIYETVEDGKQVIWYLNYLYTYVNPETNSGTYLPYQDNYVEFMIDENGNAVWLSGNEDPDVDNGFAIGATRPDGSWTGYANVNRSTYQKFTDEAPNIDPHEYEIWKLTTGAQGERVSRNVCVYFEGNDVWIKGFSKTYLPNAWAHGHINGKSVTFDQFIGECETIGQYLFLYGYTDSSGKTDLTFKYYPEEKGMTCNSEYIINPNQLFYYACENYRYPTLEFLSAGTDDIINDEELNTEWYSLDGIQVSEPSNGVYIRRTVFASGKTEYSKIFIK